MFGKGEERDELVGRIDMFGGEFLKVGGVGS